MATVTFASKLKDDGSLAIPREAVEELGLHPGDEVQVQLETKNGAGQFEGSDQTVMQAKFESFFENLDTLTFDKPTQFPNGDQAEAAFTFSHTAARIYFRPEGEGTNSASPVQITIASQRLQGAR